MSRLTALRSKYQELQPDLDRATEITRKAHAEGRALTAAESAICDPVIEKAGQILDAVKDAKSDEALYEKMRSELGPLGGAGGKSDRRLSFAGMAADAAKQMLGGEPFGVKALAPSGATVVSQGFRADPVALGQVATALLDVIPTVVQPTQEYAFLRQSVRTNLAAEVTEGAVKPTSVYTVVRVEQSLEVVAHLSEAIPRYWMVDNAAVEQFIDAELRYGLALAVEAKLLADINATSGTQAQTYSTSVLATLRKSLTKLETAGHVPSALVLAPADWEGVELALASTNAVEHLSLPYDPATRRLFGVPVVVSNSQAAGVGHALAAGAVALDVDSTGVSVAWSETSNADDWSKNLIRARCESRYGTSVYSPLGVVTADLTA